MQNYVSLVKSSNKGADIKQALSEALDLIGFKPKTSVNTVAVKVNLCYYWNASTGFTTDPRLVEALIGYLRETYGNDVEIKIVEADASAMQTKYAFPLLGFTRLAEQKKVELFNLSSDTLIEKNVTVGKRELSFQVPQLLLNCDFFINVPKLKFMREVKVTCAMKNVFGCIGYPRKVVYHEFLDEAIVGINKVLRPHLTIVDGLVALGSSPVKLGLIMAAADPFAIDAVGSRIMGYNPSSVRFLKIAARENVGNFEGIVVKGERVETFKKVYPRKFSVLNRFWGFQSWLLKTYCKIAGDVIPPALDEG